MDLGFTLPPLGDQQPRWTGAAFEVGGESRRVLAYGGQSEGWSNDLAMLQDESGGQHFMENATRTQAINQLRRHLPPGRPVIMEVGCSGGYFIRLLAATFPEAVVVGADYPLAFITRLAETLDDIPLIQFDLTDCPLPDNTFNAVVLLQVIEHIEDHEAAIRQLYRILKPGGVVLLEVPAGRRLYDAFDEYVGHFRRYDMGELTALVRGAGFEVLSRSHLGFLLYPAFWATKRLNQIRAPKTAGERREMVRGLIKTSMRPGRIGGVLMKIEEWLRQRVYLPVGMRCLMTARKPTVTP